MSSIRCGSFPIRKGRKYSSTTTLTAKGLCVNVAHPSPYRPGSDVSTLTTTRSMPAGAVKMALTPVIRSIALPASRTIPRSLHASLHTAIVHAVNLYPVLRRAGIPRAGILQAAILHAAILKRLRRPTSCDLLFYHKRDLVPGGPLATPRDPAGPIKSPQVPSCPFMSPHVPSSPLRSSHPLLQQVARQRGT